MVDALAKNQTHVTYAPGHPPLIGSNQKRWVYPDQALVSTTTTIDDALFAADIVPSGVRTVHSVAKPVQLSFNLIEDALRSPS